MSILYKIVISVTNVLKPVLIKIFPYELLRKMKGKVISNSYSEIEKITREPFDRDKYPDGINLIGDIRAESGLGQSCRLVASALAKSQVQMGIYPYNTMGVVNNNTAKEWNDYILSKPQYNVNLIHINPHELGIAYLQMDRSVFDYRYNIAYWLWELEEFPDEWIPCFKCVDEIWAPSEFICEAIRRKTKLPVRCVPYHIALDAEKKYSRIDYGLPEDKFLYLMMYDSSSCMERKNPLGVIKAFKQAFAKENDAVGLVIKINNCKDEDIRAIHREMEGYTNVYLITETLSREKVNSLIQNVDVIVSLHRAEGFGLVLAEAMLLGTPTIATNWSSNTEFMNKEMACMVDCELITIEKDMPPFKAGNRWADPDINQAAEYMKKLYEDKEFYEKLSCDAKAYVEKKFGKEEISAKIDKRIEEILQ